MHAANRCPRCGGFLFSGTNACAVCPSDDGATDDFDLLVGEPGKGEITLELEKIAERSGVSLPALEVPAQPASPKRAIAPPATILPASAQPSLEAQHESDEAEDEAARRAAFGEPLGPKLLYFVRAWNRRARMAEQAALLHRGARGVERELDLRYARLGHALLASSAEQARYPALAPALEAARRASAREAHDPMGARQAYVTLGREGYALGAGQTLEGQFWDVQRTRTTYETMRARAARIERIREGYDRSAYARGRLALSLITLAVLLLALGLCFI